MPGSPPTPLRSPPAPVVSGAALAPVVRRNVAALAELRAAEERRRTFTDRLVLGVTRFAGSMGCVYVHLLWISAWLDVNLGYVRAVRPFDPSPFPLLSTVVCAEGLFLAIFILISQNRAQRLADRRAELDVQIGLLTEHELTQAVHLLDAVAGRLGVRHGVDLADIKRDVHPAQVVEEIVKAEGEEGSAE